MKLHKYKIFCQTDNKWEKVIKIEGEDAPTTCPIDTNHTVVTDSEAIEEVIDTEAQKDSEGAFLSRTKITTTGWSYQLHGLEYKTAQLDSIYSKKEDGSDFGFTTIKCYDPNDVELTTQGNCDANAVKTIIDWEPTHDYEALGGFFKLSQAVTEDVRLWVIGVPDVPAQYGGSKVFVSNINLKYIGIEEGIRVDGRAPKYLTYDVTNHTNKLRLIIKHPAGLKVPCHMIFEIFKP